MYSFSLSLFMQMCIKSILSIYILNTFYLNLGQLKSLKKDLNDLELMYVLARRNFKFKFLLLRIAIMYNICSLSINTISLYYKIFF